MTTKTSWVHDFTITNEDIDYLNALLLEREVPLDTRTLARAIVNERVRKEKQKLADRFKDATPYDPAQDYEVGERLVFTKMDYEMAEVVEKRTGENGEYGAFEVVRVEFEHDSFNPEDGLREFAINFPAEHPLNIEDTTDNGLPTGQITGADEIIQSDFFYELLDMVDDRLMEDDSLIRVAGYWFARELMVQTNDGHLHLAEAVLDMAEGGPLSTNDILEQIGGLGDEAKPLQVFSLNYALNEDDRFDEVGPAGEVLWFLKRMEPQQVQNTPEMLKYTPIPYDRDTLSREAGQLELDLGDENSPLPYAPGSIQEARVTIIYPHRRCGTLPLNHEAARIFPTARKTERVAVNLIDAEDGDSYRAWVVRKDKYVDGLNPLYTKHALPIGSTVLLRRGDTPGDIIIDVQAYKPRSEHIIIVNAESGQIGFETAKRGIGANFDEFLLLGVDDLEGVDKLFQTEGSKQQPLATILRVLIPMLSKFTHQGHVHAKTLYSAVNVVRRCPPGPILATLANNPDFENVGGHYWKLS